MFSARLGQHDLAVVSAGNDAIAIGGSRENRAAMNGNTPLAAVGGGEQQRLLAEHEDGAPTKEMRADDRRSRRDRPGALDHGGNAGLGHDAVRRLGGAGLKALADFLLGQVAPDEHDAAVALLAILPRPLVIAVEDHVHTLEHEPVRIVLERQNSFAAQNAGAVLGDEILHPGKELVGIERLVGLQRHRLHVLVVIMLQPMIVVMMVVVVMTVIMIVTVAGQKFRLDRDDAIEIEGIAAEHLGQRNLAALGPMHLGIGIDAANAVFHFAQLLPAEPDRSC